MLSVGIDAALDEHQGEIQNDKGKILWKGRLENNKKGRLHVDEIDKLINARFNDDDQSNFAIELEDELEDDQLKEDNVGVNKKTIWD